ncbi:hypothetical protein RFI_08274 [Reticulomyxa filosa]|uniref:Uncharacterized protein n=1 Tax=Reticulomyxa filosa TaxID=46433 RepID=X6NSD8_RETFI|nr:hypothetical protein RFI_08274 [Reticulomyxa filosa]|eukprot:ETO28853.1 hypothetical protein RFI_08274 [Reticulomyxa filosa]
MQVYVNHAFLFFFKKSFRKKKKKGNDHIEGYVEYIEENYTVFLFVHVPDLKFALLCVFINLIEETFMSIQQKKEFKIKLVDNYCDRSEKKVDFTEI